MAQENYITRIDFPDILPYWAVLWPGQDHQQFSSMLMMGKHDHHIKDKFKWRGWAVKNGSRTVGVNAGHKSAKGHYRTRGLWVAQDFRGKGIGQMLFNAAEEQAKNEHCRWLWSYPRLQALGAYQKAGFESYGPTNRGEWDDCVRAKKDLSIITTTVWSLFENPLEDQAWLEHIDMLDKDGILLGQNEEVRGNVIHITQHWLNDLVRQELVVPGNRNPLQVIKGDPSNNAHVL